MSFFKSFTKDSQKKIKAKNYEEEYNLLKITFNHILKENEALKTEINDLKTTIKLNKNVLREYIEKITDKDEAVKKLMFTIETLQKRLMTQEEALKR